MEVEADSEKQSPGWIQKYLDLADLMMRGRRGKHDAEKSSVA